MIFPDEDLTLLDEKGRDIIQKKKGFRFSIDAVILSEFFKVKKQGNLLEVGTGTGIIPILLAKIKEVEKITAVEIQPEMADLAERNIVRNKLKDKIEIICGDIKDLKRGNNYDYIISNPPYMLVDGKKINFQDTKAISRHEISLTLVDLVKNAKRLLKPRGQFFMVHRSYRFGEIMRALEDEGFSIKRARFVYYDRERNSNLVLVEASKGKKEILNIEPPLYLNY